MILKLTNLKSTIIFTCFLFISLNTVAQQRKTNLCLSTASKECFCKSSFRQDETFRSISYSDELGSLRGSWSMYPVTDGYYDGYGHYKEGYHNEFSLQLYEPGNGNPAGSWLFDDNDYNGGSSFKAVYTSGRYTYEYTFVRE